MRTVFELSTTNYEENIESITKALEDLQKLCEIEDGYQFSKPMSRFGWTFFKLLIKPNLSLKITEQFADMIKKAKGSKQEEKFRNFLSDFFASSGCNIKIKLIEED